MVAKTALTLASDTPLLRHDQSGASSRTLTPVGVNPQDFDQDSDEFHVGTLTPPRQVVWSTLGRLKAELPCSDESSTEGEEKDSWLFNPFALVDECKVCDPSFPKQVFALPPGPIQSTLAQTDAYQSTLAQIDAYEPKLFAPGPMKTNLVQAEPAPSLGSMGHPFSCAEACKYYRRKGGCRDGNNCTNCHLCHWSRDSTQRKPITQDSNPLRVAVPNPTAEDGGPPSVGSIGHPFSCNTACKYQTKKAGCKDGKFCSRCHLCRWTRGCEKDNGNGERKVKTSAAPDYDSNDGIRNAAAQGAPQATAPGDDKTALLLSPRRVEIQRTFENEAPMYVTILGSTSF